VTRFVLRRLVLAVSMVWAVSFGAFCAFGLSFDPTYWYALCTSGTCRDERQQLIDQFHLHDPILVRYWIWLEGLFTHGFGRTVTPGHFSDGDSRIGTALWPAAGVTAQLILVSLVLVVVLSVAVGVVSARWQGSPPDVLLRLFAYVAWSLPAFLVGVLLWRWLEPTGWFYAGPPGGGVVRWTRTMVLSALSLSFVLM
jgi:peptide/nickel transport system permease protein